MNAIDDSADGALKLRNVYIEELRTHAVTLIWLGHAKLDAASFVTADEDVITGELVKSIKLVLQAPNSPDWVDRYEVHEQVRQNVDEKRGKVRPIMDIEIERHVRGDRPKLGFEAKRLGRGYGVSGYLGDEGLAAFLNGYYPITHGEAGMLGYVQNETVEGWADKLRAKLCQDGDGNQIETVMPQVTGMSGHAYYSSTHNSSSAAPLLMSHILLPFHSDIE